MLAKYDVNKMVTDFNEESQDWSGQTRDFGDVTKGTMDVGSVEEFLEKIQNELGLQFPFEAVPDEPGRYETNQAEDGDGRADDNGKWLADYNVYVKFYGDPIEPPTRKTPKKAPKKTGSWVNVEYRCKSAVERAR